MASPHDAFVARRADLETLQDALAGGTRWIVVVGPGGIGKTRLARELGSSAAEPHLFLDASAAASAHTLGALVLAALGATSARDDDVGVGDALADRGPLLVLLDNIEQLEPGVSAHVARWLERAPELRLLATSRVAPPVRGPLRHRLTGLTKEQAAELFMTRAREHGVPIEGSDAALETLLEHLDGHPLAIELAAARCDLVGVGELAERVGRSLDVLRSAAADRPERHLSLEAVFEGSLRALSASDAAALSECAVFKAPFDLESAEAVLEGEDTEGALRRLFEASLLSVATHAGSGRRRLRLLHPLRRLLDSPTEALRARHAAYFIDRAERASADGGLETLTALREDIAAAVEHAWASGRETQAARGALVLARADGHAGWALGAARRLEAAESRLGRVRLDVRRRFRLERGRTFCQLGEREAAAAEARALEDDEDAQAEAAWLRGVLHLLAGQLDDAERELERALEMHRSHGDLLGQSDALAYLGRVARARGQLSEAATRFEQALAQLEEGDTSGRALQLSIGLANCELETGRSELACARYAEIVSHARASQHAAAEGCALGNWAVADHAAGRLDDARARYDEALARLTAVAERVLRPMYRSSAALLALQRADMERARELSVEAVRRARPNAAVWSLSVEATRLAWVDEPQRAEARFAEAERLAMRRGEAAAMHCVDTLRAASRLRAGGADALESARAVRWEAEHGGARSALHRLALGCLAQTIAEGGWADEVRSPPVGALLVAEDGSRFATADAIEPAEVAAAPARRLLVVLARHHRSDAPGPLDAWALIARVWPGEAILPKAGKNRLAVSLSQLRRAGLGALIERRDGGYALRSDTAVLFADPSRISRR